MTIMRKFFAQKVADLRFIGLRDEYKSIAKYGLLSESPFQFSSFLKFIANLKLFPWSYIIPTAMFFAR